MDDLEAKVRLIEAAAGAYGGVGSMHTDGQGIAKIASDWYNGIDSWKKPDTAPLQGTLKVPVRAPPK